MSKYSRVHFEEAIHSSVRPCCEPEEAEASRQMLTRFLRQVIQWDLTPRQRDVIVLYYYEKRSLREIADLWQVHPSTVSHAKSRACQILKQRLRFYPFYF